MAKKPQYDGVVDAVHYNSDGSVKWLRAYERRGPTFSDLILIPREEMIARLKAGKVFMVGQRVSQMGSTFEVHDRIQLADSGAKEVLVSGEQGQPDHDRLPDVPVI
jgi:hypothetical protein